MNRIFYGMVVFAFAVAASRQLVFDLAPWLPEDLPALFAVVPDGPEWKEPLAAMTDALFDMVKIAVMNVVLPLVGAMAFFLGLLKVAEKAGAMLFMAKLLRPLMVLLFPSVPPNHPAMSAMILNIAANAFGLGNAATPFGLRAMQELDKLNGEKGTASDAMCLFLAINTSGVTLLATGVVAIRATFHSNDPAAVIPTTLFATACSTVAAITVAKLAERLSPGAPSVVDETVTDEASDAFPLWVSGLALVGLLALIPATLVWGSLFGKWIVPTMIIGFLTWGFVRGVPIYEAFVEGAREGWDTAVRIIPFLVAILGMVGLLRGAGAIDLFSAVVGPVTEPLGMPAEALPMALLRPLSGSGASGVMMSILTEHGPDSYVGYLVSTMQGSTETTFYVLAVYFGSVGVKRVRHAMFAGIVADTVGVVAAIVAVSIYFTYKGLW
ncbi:MAG: hypothetical protein KC621_21665 [Myxococcales bacterium]|nr:hypothetical protein [Myxococcales bacterium]